ncbi:MAG: peptidase T, partial [Bacteroidota bacterium]
MDLLKNIQQGVTERFLRYVQIDTQSDPQSTTVPSTAKQKDLGRLLLTELQELG